MQIFTIERGLPIPTGGYRGQPSPYPFANLSIGDSFLVPFDFKVSGRALTPQQLRSRLHGAAACVRRRHPERKFTIRNSEDGVRCWRAV